MKTFCFVAPFFVPHVGGIERYVYGASKEIISRGDRVIVLCNNDQRDFVEECIDGIEIIRLGSVLALNNRLPLPIPNLKFLKIIQTLVREKIDLFVINGRFYPLSPLIAFSAKLARKKCILIEHGTGHFTLSNHFLTLLSKIYEHLITFFLRFVVQDFYGVSKECCIWLKHFGIKCHGVIYNSIIVDSYKKSEPKTDKATQYVNISFIGRLIPEKGILRLIEAFRMLDDERAKLLIAGTGPLSGQIQKATEEYDNIHFLGKLNHEQVIDLLASTDILVHPSLYPEGLPTVLLEAGLMKCAVITTNAGGSKEVVPSFDYGIQIDGSVEQIKHALEVLVSDETLRNKISTNLHQRVVNSFSWEKNVEHLYLSIGD